MAGALAPAAWPPLKSHIRAHALGQVAAASSALHSRLHPHLAGQGMSIFSRLDGVRDCQQPLFVIPERAERAPAAAGRPWTSARRWIFAGRQQKISRP